MGKKLSKKQSVKLRVRSKLSGRSIRPRLSVFKSNKDIYCQVIDDIKGITVASANTLEMSGTKTEQASAVGKVIAEKAIAANIDTVVFDRSGYIYHGRIKALADGAREGGLKF